MREKRTDPGRLSNRWVSQAVSATLVSLCAAFYLVMLANAPLVADDYCYGVMGRKQGPLSMSLRMYSDWSGRLVANWLLATAMQFPRPIAKCIPGLCMLGLVVGIALLVRRASAIAGKRVSRIESLAIASATSVLFMVSQNDVFQVYFWVTGACNYFVPVVLWVLAIGLLFRSLDKRRSDLQSALRRASGSEIAAGVCLGIAALCSESVGFIIFVSICVVGTLFARARRYLLVDSVVFIPCLAAAVLAPGNGVRRRQFTPMPLPQSIVRGLQEANLTIVFRIFLRPWALLGAIALGVILAVWFGGKEHSKTEMRKVTGSCWLVFLLALVGGEISSYFSIGLPLPSRALSGEYAMFAVALIVTSFAFVNSKLNGVALRASAISRKKLASSTIFVLAGLAIALCAMLLPDLRTFQAFQAEAERQIALLPEPGLAKPLEIATTGPLLALDGSQWTSECMADFFRKGKIVRNHSGPL